MATYNIFWKPSAEKDLRRIDKKMIPRILDAIGKIAANPFQPGIRKLQSTEHTYRMRVGEYRIIYSLEQAALIIEIVRVKHRKDVYKS